MIMVDLLLDPRTTFRLSLSMCLRVKETWTCGCENLRRAPRCQNAIAYQKVCQNVKTVKCSYALDSSANAADNFQLRPRMRQMQSAGKPWVSSVRRRITSTRNKSQHRVTRVRLVKLDSTLSGATCNTYDTLGLGEISCSQFASLWSNDGNILQF
jgi:hypothetical protein